MFLLKEFALILRLFLRPAICGTVKKTGKNVAKRKLSQWSFTYQCQNLTRLDYIIIVKPTYIVARGEFSTVTKAVTKGNVH